MLKRTRNTTLDDMMMEPIVRLVMNRDGVSEAKVRRVMEEARAGFEIAQEYKLLRAEYDRDADAYRRAVECGENEGMMVLPNDHRRKHNPNPFFGE